MKKLYIIVLNFNGGKEILACLKSLYLAKVPKNWQVEIIVVDNSSVDNSLQLIKLKFKKLKIIENEKNLGFAAGNNLGIKLALQEKADAVVLLNQDTVVEKDFLVPLLKNKEDIIAPVIKFKREGRWVYSLGGRVNLWTGRTKHLEFNSYSVSELTGYELDYVSGCAMLIRRPVLEKIGLLDERFFLYFEDDDFCLRAKKAGFKIAVEPKSVILHKLSPTKKKPLWQNLHLLRSNLLFINLWILWWRRPIAYFYWFFLCLKILFFS